MAEEKKKEEVTTKPTAPEKEEPKVEAKGAEPKKTEKEETKVEAKGGEQKKTEAEAKEEERPKIELSKKSQEIMKTIEGMTVLELSGLVKALEEKFGVSAAAPMGQMALTPGAVAAGAEAEEKTTFTAVLAKVGDKKIQVIKEIRTFTNLGLKEAKDLVESSPVPVKEDVSKEEAEEIKKKLEAVGAAVEIK